jgi:hypothetical protein
MADVSECGYMGTNEEGSLLEEDAVKSGETNLWHYEPSKGEKNKKKTQENPC